MQRLFLFSLLLLYGKSIFCQKIDKEIQFQFDTAYNTAAVDINRTTFDGKILQVMITDTTSKIKVAAFLRITDDSYFYQSFDTTGKIIAEGKAITDQHPFRIIKIPVFDRNGNQSGIKLWGFYKFHKTGKWYEALNDSISCYGNYINNKKNGDWFYNKLIAKSNPIPLKKETYKLDSLKTTANLNSLEGDRSRIMQEICGRWEILNPGALWYLDTIIYYRKIPVNKRTDSRHYISFTPNGKGYILTAGHHKAYKKEFNWHFLNGHKQIMINLHDDHFNCRVIFLSKEMLVGIFGEYRMSVK